MEATLNRKHPDFATKLGLGLFAAYFGSLAAYPVAILLGGSLRSGPAIPFALDTLRVLLVLPLFTMLIGSTGFVVFLILATLWKADLRPGSITAFLLLSTVAGLIGIALPPQSLWFSLAHHVALEIPSPVQEPGLFMMGGTVAFLSGSLFLLLYRLRWQRIKRPS